MSKKGSPLKKVLGAIGGSLKKHGSSSNSSSSSSNSNSNSRMKKNDAEKVLDPSTTATATSTGRMKTSGESSSLNVRDDDDTLRSSGRHPAWSLDLDRHHLGDYSFAAIKGNSVIEDYSEVIVGGKSTFIGIYDGHGGHEVAQYLFNNLFNFLMDQVRDTGTMSTDSLTQVFDRIETGWHAKVATEFNDRPLIASIGASCLVAVVCGTNLYVANAGGCRAITSDSVVAMDHNMKHQEINIPLSIKHQNDQSKFAEKSGKTYLIKGRTEFSKSIGDEYLKHPQYNLDDHDGFKLNEPLVALDNAAVESAPFTTIIPIVAHTRWFIVLASHGFWDIMRDKDVTPVVERGPRKGIAATLITEALKKVAKREGKTYSEILNKKDESGRKLYHDDITVVVIYFNMHLNEKVIQEPVSVRVGENHISTLDNTLKGGDKAALERTEPGGDSDQALQGEDEGADEALKRTEPGEDLGQALQGEDEALERTDQALQGANVGR